MSLGTAPRGLQCASVQSAQEECAIHELRDPPLACRVPEVTSAKPFEFLQERLQEHEVSVINMHVCLYPPLALVSYWVDCMSDMLKI